MFINPGRLLTLILLAVLLSAMPCPAAETHSYAEGTDSGLLSGQFKLKDGTPLSGGRLFIYDLKFGPPSSDHYARVPDIIDTLDPEGKFALRLPAGTFYLSAVKMPKDGAMGPPQDGEPIYYKMNAKGEIEPSIVAAGKETNAGTISSMALYKRDLTVYEQGSTMIEGMVVDANGTPVGGAVVLAHVTPGTDDKAVYVSERTMKDGKFRMRLNDGGTYYLRVRSNFRGGMPSEGELINLVDPKEQIAVSVSKGEKVTGITIKVKHQPQRGPLYNSSTPGPGPGGPGRQP
jgi:hypothetical protein